MLGVGVGAAERRGLIGGYKKMWRTVRDERRAAGQAEPILKKQALLDKAIENYRRGMELDLNEYYCVCNLPGLLRDRNVESDTEEAEFLDRLTVLAVRLKIDRGEADEWARPTLLGTAFRVGDVEGVQRLTKEVAGEGPAVWKLDTTLSDINDTIAAMPASEKRGKLENCREQLADLNA